jgi:hypothetical protein
VSRLAVGVVDVQGGRDDEACVLVEALRVGEGQLAVGVELALHGGVEVELVASAHGELGGGRLGLVEVEGRVEPSGGEGGHAVVVGHSHAVALEEAEEGEDVVVGGVRGGAVDGGEGPAAVLGLETYGEALVSDHTSEVGLGAFGVEDVHGPVEGDVVVLVLSVELDGVEFLGVNLASPWVSRMMW